MEPKQKIFVTIGTVAVIAAASIGGLALFKSPEISSAQTTSPTSTQTVASTPLTSTTATTPVTTNTTTSTSTTTSTAAATNTYKDGTYTKTVNYTVPKGYSNSITVTLIVSGGVITSATTDNSYTDRESGMYVADFESAVSGNASGKSLSSYSPSRIGGASLTTYAFSNAIDSIRTQAAA